MSKIEEFLKDYAPRYNSMTLACNTETSANYMTAEEWITNNPEDFKQVDKDEIKRMIDTNVIWYLQIYPDTPIGSYTIYGATAEYVIDCAMEELS